MPSEQSRKRRSIRRMLEPQSIAVVGATPRPQYGGRFLRSVLEAEDKVRVYPVNPRYPDIMGVRCYASLSELPESPDLVGVIVPYHQVLPVLNQSAEAGAGAAVVVSAGFAERGKRRTQPSSGRNRPVRSPLRAPGLRPQLSWHRQCNHRRLAKLPRTRPKPPTRARRPRLPERRHRLRPPHHPRHGTRPRLFPRHLHRQRG